jgi:tRNA (cmo5U34)-methyltransferase
LSYIFLENKSVTFSPFSPFSLPFLLLFPKDLEKKNIGRLGRFAAINWWKTFFSISMIPAVFINLRKNTKVAIMAKDNIYSAEIDPVPPFEFNEEVVRVFNDMIRRSVPFYEEIICRQAQLTARFYQIGTRIYDLGCSNGNLGAVLAEVMKDRPFAMVAVDNSAPMLEAYKARLEEKKETRIQLLHADMEEVEMEEASVVIVNLTLQFLSPERRDALIEKIHSALKPGGILLLTEKVVHREEELSKLQQAFYYGFKKEQGYSQLEISQKREALENVLVPETLEKHFARLQDSGFKKIDIWMKWFNFASLLAVKG